MTTGSGKSQSRAQLSLLLPVNGGKSKDTCTVMGTSTVKYKSKEFYEIRDRLIASLPKEASTSK